MMGNQIAVVSILFNKDSTITEDVFDNIPIDGGMANFRASFDNIGDKFYYHYSGSKTKPYDC